MANSDAAKAARTCRYGVALMFGLIPVAVALGLTGHSAAFLLIPYLGAQAWWEHRLARRWDALANG